MKLLDADTKVESIRIMKGKSPCFLLILALFPVITTSLFAAEFSAKFVDGLGRPISEVSVSVYWLKSLPADKVDRVELLKLISGADGSVKGSYDEKSVPADEPVIKEVSKDGYKGYSTDNVQSEYVMARIFRAGDIDRIAKLSGAAQMNELKELLAGDIEHKEKSPEDLAFFYDEQLRPALRALVQDAKVGIKASTVLAFIGEPDDLRLVVQHAPKPKRELFEDRWAYEVVTAIFEPSSETEWSFLETCAANEYDDLWVDAGAINTLKLIASPKSAEILKRVLTKNPDRKVSILSALNYIESHPPVLADKDLVEAGKKVAQVIKIGKWQGNKNPRYNEKGDKALIDCEFIEGRDLLIDTATFHKVGDFWKLRGLRETMQAFLAQPVEHKSDINSK